MPLLSRIKGTTAVEIASGLHWYLKYWCGAHISWDKTGGIQVASVPHPGSLPRVKDSGVIVIRPVSWSYYQNVVTSSCTETLPQISTKNEAQNSPKKDNTNFTLCIDAPSALHK
ncbi:hypothetical protein QJS04_geneDACA016899 [Acorus gramineus]|uniref:Alpha-N-acetylglucosaminidase N-terminal domain-containing protein n=1 Tax=Acorus gramineus TaxID=55184 RepID=A0AAV9BRG6_ACOGR|nr:hypothetical protein QJS04_geneDACA016899 [Acorus gramineus]